MRALEKVYTHHFVYAKPEYFVYANECRPPRKGEFFLSGAKPEVYQAPNDLGMAYHIMKPYKLKENERVIDGIIYVPKEKEIKP